MFNENPFLDLITASWKINESLPLFLIRKLREKTPLVGKKVLILGLAFKPEIDDIRPDDAFLKWVATSSGGQYYGPGEWGPPLRDGSAGRLVWDRRETPLWRAPGLALLVLLSAGTAWIVRRRAGLQ
jgi:hypothetical protein